MKRPIGFIFYALLVVRIFKKCFCLWKLTFYITARNLLLEGSKIITILLATVQNAEHTCAEGLANHYG